MSEFETLTSDEVRVLREHRAVKATQERPVDKGEVLLRLMLIIRDAAKAGEAIDSSDPMWRNILSSVPLVKPLD